jgi:hypothetical protein
MASAEFSQFVATVLLSNTSTLSAFKTSPGIHTVFPILPAAFTIRALCAVIGFWLGMLLSPLLVALYAISIRQARALPVVALLQSLHPVFFRFRHTMDNPAFG